MFWNFKIFKFVKTTKQVISDGSGILDIKWYSGSFHPSELEDIVPNDINDKLTRILNLMTVVQKTVTQKMIFEFNILVV